jgi:hypothetical protein
LAIVPLTPYCTKAPLSVDKGSGTGVGNGVILGTVLYSDSRAVQGAVVRLRTTSFFADTSGTPSLIQNDTIATVATDSSGRFHIDSVDTGRTYFVEVNDNKALDQGTLFKVIMARPDTVRLPPRIVTPMKVLKGTIRISGLPANAYVLIYGLERGSRVNANGTFEISDLPLGKCEEGECEYRVRIIMQKSDGTILSVDSQLDIEFDAQGNIKEVELELGD